MGRWGRSPGGVRIWRRAVAVGLACGLAGCIYVPQTREVYDAGCQITYRQMTLEPVQIASLSRCSNQECGAALVFIGATAAASAVVSGSIVVVGNVVYWFEKQGRCIRER